jgi:hypothetical protein
VKLVRLLLLSPLALIAFGVASASAGEDGIASFEPKLGAYAGTLRSGNLTSPVSGEVTKAHGHFYVQVDIHAKARCSDETERAVKLDHPARLRGTAFKFLSKSPDAQLGGGRSTYAIDGSFSRGRAFSGSASKEGGTSSTFCLTGRLYFSLHKK